MSELLDSVQAEIDVYSKEYAEKRVNRAFDHVDEILSRLKFTLDEKDAVEFERLRANIETAKYDMTWLAIRQAIVKGRNELQTKLITLVIPEYIG